MLPAAWTEVTVSCSGAVALPENWTWSVPKVAAAVWLVSPCKALIVAEEVTDVVDIAPTVSLPPVRAWAWKEMVFSEPPVELALNPETKFIVVWVPFRMFRPLNEAPLTASVSCWLSEASEVLMSPIAAPGSPPWSLGRHRIQGREDGIDRRGGGREHHWPSDSALCDAVTTPLSEPSCWAIEQSDELSDAFATLRPVETSFWTVFSDCCVRCSDCKALSAAES